MNYRHVYMCIIAHAKSEEKLGLRKKGNGEYYERHHILPKSLFPLWTKEKRNLVLLTFREHFFCHQLLTKIFRGPSMYAALAYMFAHKKCNSRQYEICRKAYYDFNKSRSRESILAATEKMRKTIKSRLENDENFKQKYIEDKRRAGLSGNTVEAKIKRSQTRSGKSYTESCRKGFETLKNLGKYESWCEKVGLSCKDKKWFNNGIKEIRSSVKPEGFDEGRVFRCRPNSQVGEKNNNAIKIVNIDNGWIFGTMKHFCSTYNLKISVLRNYIKFYNIKRDKVIEISLERLKEFQISTEAKCCGRHKTKLEVIGEDVKQD